MACDTGVDVVSTVGLLSASGPEAAGRGGLLVSGTSRSADRGGDTGISWSRGVKGGVFGSARVGCDRCCCPVGWGGGGGDVVGCCWMDRVAGV